MSLFISLCSSYCICSSLGQTQINSCISWLFLLTYVSCSLSKHAHIESFCLFFTLILVFFFWLHLLLKAFEQQLHICGAIRDQLIPAYSRFFTPANSTQSPGTQIMWDKTMTFYVFEQLQESKIIFRLGTEIVAACAGWQFHVVRRQSLRNVSWLSDPAG